MKIKEDSYMYEMIRTELTDVVGNENVDTKFADKFGHSIDYYWIPEMWHDRGRPCPKPDFVVHPKTTAEVARIMKIANQYKIPVVPWGGGSGSQGGALPIYNGIVLDMKRMNRIVKIDKQALTVTAQTGIITKHLEWGCNKAGLSTMHLPASIACSTIGGFLAHRGTGVLSTKYGKIEDMVMSLEVVTPTGEIIRTLPVPRHASGPDLTMLFLGSEGTLGVITEVTLKVHPQPESRQFRAYIFKDFHTAMQAGQTLMRSRLQPCEMRLYDETETKTHVSKVFGIDLDKGAYLVFGFDGRKDIVDLQMKHAREIMEGEFKGKDLGSKGGEWWWENKYKFFYPGYMFHVPQAFGTLDTVADFSHIENVYWAMKKVVNTEFPDARFIGHFSHWYDWGCMLYARFIFPGDKVPPNAEEAAALYNAVWDKAIRAAIREGGVINEHHGVGLKLGRYMKDLYGKAMPLLEGIKQKLDPNGIMNPGKMGLAGC